MRHIQMLINAPTLLPNLSVSDRLCGFSDAWYDNGTETQVLQTKDTMLINKRAALLPQSTTVVGARISLLDAFGKSQGRSRVYHMGVQGGDGGPTGDPRQCLQYSLFAQGATNELQAYIQNVPTQYFLTGSYKSNSDWEQRLKNYFKFVYDNDYRFYAFDQSLPVAPVISITALGVVTLERNNVWTIGQYVRVLRSKTDLRGNFRTNPNGYHVSASAGLSVTLDGWDQGACTGGTMQTWGKYLASPTLDDYEKQHPQVASRKVGKPFFLFRGRASKKA